MLIKPGQRRFLSNAGYSEESLNKMTSGTAKTLIANIEAKRREEQEKQYKAMYHYAVSCLVCNSAVEISEYEARTNIYCIKLCSKCRDAIMTIRDRLGDLQ